MLLLVSTWLLLQPGYLDSDERATFALAEAFVKARYDWSAFLASLGVAPGHLDLFHGTAWFLIQTILYEPYWQLARFIPSLDKAIFAQVYMSALLEIPVWVAIVLCWRLLRRKQVPVDIAALALAGIWVGSYGICYLTECVMANTEAMLMVAQLLIFEGGKGHPRRRFVMLGGMAALTVALKPYALPCVAAIAFLASEKENHERRSIIAWLVGFVIPLIAIFAFQFFYAVQTRNFFDSVSPPILSWAFLPEFLSRFAASLFSMSYGIVPTFPFFGLALLASDKKTLAIKGAAVVLMLFSTLLYPFWNGASGIAGNRYIFPYLLIFVPEIAEGFESVLSRDRKFALALCALVLLFFPCLFYRHNITVEYAVGRTIGGLQHPVVGEPVGNDAGILKQQMPIWDPQFHPAVFAWRQSLATLWHTQLTLPLRKPVSLDPALIPPKSFVARIAYLASVDPKAASDDRVKAAKSAYERLPSYLTGMVFGLLALVSAIWTMLFVRSVFRVVKHGP